MHNQNGTYLDGLELRRADLDGLASVALIKGLSDAVDHLQEAAASELLSWRITYCRPMYWYSTHNVQILTSMTYLEVLGESVLKLGLEDLVVLLHTATVRWKFWAKISCVREIQVGK